MTELIQYINSFVSLNKEEEEAIKRYFKPERVKKKELIVIQDQICSKLWFVKSGLARSYCVNKEGTEKVTNFYVENEFMTVTPSYNQQIPSGCFIQAMEEMELWSITRKNELQLLQIPIFSLFNALLHRHYLLRINIFQDAIRGRGSLERYQYLLEEHPEIIKRAKQKDVASLLGISPSTLSRIRAR